MTGYAALEIKKNELIRKGIQGSVFLAQYSAAAVSVATLFGVTGDLAALPSGYNDLGWLDDTGVAFARKVTATSVPGWGSLDPLRQDITEDTTTLELNAEETNLITLGLFANVQSSSLVAAANGVLAVPVPTTPTPTQYKALIVGVDESPNGEIVIARYFPNAMVTDYKSQSYSMKDVVAYGVTLTANMDSPSGFAQEFIFGGAGWLYLLSDMGIPRNSVATVALTTTLVLTTGAFMSYDVGATVTGAGIAPGTTIASVTNTTTAVMSAEGTIAGTLVPVVIG